jgi:hypothetical protein
MNTKKEMSIAVIFLAAAIVFVASTPITNHVFAKSHDAQGDSGSKYEKFLNCISDAAGPDSYPADDQIVNCYAESGYTQGSSSTSNIANSEDRTGNVDVGVVGNDKSADNSNDKSADNSNDKSADSQTGNVDVGVVGNDKSADSSNDKSADSSNDKSADSSNDNSADNSNDNSADSSNDKSADNSNDNSADSSND